MTSDCNLQPTESDVPEGSVLILASISSVQIRDTMVRTVIASTDPQASSGPSMPRDNVPSYLGYDLNSFGPYGLQWMLERQVDDEVFCSPQSTYQAEKALGHSVQRLDHICDHHFPTNLERFGFVRQPITQSTGGKRPKCPCSRTAERDTCPSCRPCTPVFMYT